MSRLAPLLSFLVLMLSGCDFSDILERNTLPRIERRFVLQDTAWVRQDCGDVDAVPTTFIVAGRVRLESETTILATEVRFYNRRRDPISPGDTLSLEVNAFYYHHPGPQTSSFRPVLASEVIDPETVPPGHYTLTLENLEEDPVYPIQIGCIL